MSLDGDALGELLDGLGIGLEPTSAVPEIGAPLAAVIRRESKAALERAAADGAEAVWSSRRTSCGSCESSASRFSRRNLSSWRRSTPLRRAGTVLPGRRGRFGAAEPIPKDPAKHDLWVSLLAELAREQLAHAFADEKLH